MSTTLALRKYPVPKRSFGRDPGAALKEVLSLNGVTGSFASSTTGDPLVSALMLFPDLGATRLQPLQVKIESLIKSSLSFEQVGAWIMPIWIHPSSVILSSKPSILYVPFRLQRECHWPDEVSLISTLYPRRVSSA